jgi:hypothetical protein
VPPKNQKQSDSYLFGTKAYGFCLTIGSSIFGMKEIKNVWIHGYVKHIYIFPDKRDCCHEELEKLIIHIFNYYSSVNYGKFAKTN